MTPVNNNNDITTDTADDNTPGGMGTEIITYNIRSYNEDGDAQRRQVQDAAELLFGNNAEDEEHGASSQTWSLFNKRNMMISLCIAAIVFLCVVTGLSSAALTGRNNSMVVESFNNGAPMASAKSTKAPKSGSGSQCISNTLNPPAPAGNEPIDCFKCCNDCGGIFSECNIFSPDTFPDVPNRGKYRCFCDASR